MMESPIIRPFKHARMPEQQALYDLYDSAKASGQAKSISKLVEPKLTAIAQKRVEENAKSQPSIPDIFGTLTVGGLLLSVGWCAIKPADPEAEQRKYALNDCFSRVEAAAKYPAEMDYDYSTITNTGSEVRGQVDLKNGFGVKSTHEFRCRYSDTRLIEATITGF